MAASPWRRRPNGTMIVVKTTANRLEKLDRGWGDRYHLAPPAVTCLHSSCQRDLHSACGTGKNDGSAEQGELKHFTTRGMRRESELRSCLEVRGA